MSRRPSTPSREASAPIAYFDSGVGGLTVLAQAIARLPRESSLYIADQLHVPYGGRPLEEIRGFAAQLTDFAFAAGAKMVVMACNISSATYADEAADHYGAHRVLGVVRPGSQAAVRATRNQRIGILATEGTVHSEAYPRTLRTLEPGLAAIHQVACPAFVPLVEAGRAQSPAAEAAVREALSPLIAAEVDTIILGCTHYPFLLPLLQKVAPWVRFVDPSEATATLVQAQLQGQMDGLVPAPEHVTEPSHRWLTTGNAAHFADAAHRFLGEVQGRCAIGHLAWPPVHEPMLSLVH